VRRWLKPAAFPLLLLALNFYFVKDLFSLEYSQFMGSIEAAYISISRYMIENWRDLTWFPLWYGGIPFQNTYPPLLHAVVALAAVSFRISPAHAHHIVTALFYCLGPVALYGLALRLTGSRWYSFWAAWIYSVFSPCSYLMPSVLADMGGIFGLRRFQALLPYGEGPHITSMALLPIALLGLDLALAKRTPVRCTFAALAIAAVVLSNWLGGFALAAAVFVYLLARTNSFAAWRMWRTSFLLCALAYSLACCWIPPSTIRDIRHNAQFVGSFEHVYQRLPLYASLGVVALLGVKYAMYRWKISGSLQFFVLFALGISAIPLAAEWCRVDVVPQPMRYHLEMDLALSLAAVFGLRSLTTRLSPRYKTALVAVLLALSFFQARLDRRYSRRMIKPVNIFGTAEYQTAKWFDAHVDGGRVMAAGTVSYWLNAFSDTPQFGGGFDQGIANRTYNLVSYQILSADGAGERAAEIAELWLQAYGVQAIAVGGPGSRGEFKPFRHPEAFAKSFAEATRDGDDAVYWVPGRGTPFARVIGSRSLVRNRPVNGLDIAQLQAYVHALQDPNLAPVTFRWTSRHSAQIQAEVRRQEVISVPLTYHPGWHAFVNGASRRLYGDGLGLAVVDPECNGSCRVELTYDGGWEMRIARIASWASFAGCLIWIALYRLRRRNNVS
jgi:hypothetical protein